MKEIILATTNKGKLAELQALLFPLPCIPQANLHISEATETGLSFVENALIKARHVSQITNQAALADDSGLVVPALNDEPGIYSARFAGEKARDADNIALLLAKMAKIPSEERQAFFYCALALTRHARDPVPLIAVGKLVGSITEEPQGENGFGYDPIFYIPAHQCTAAQLSAKIKNTISHRAQALKQLSSQLSYDSK